MIAANGKFTVWACPDCLGDIDIPIAPEVLCVGCGRTVGQWYSAYKHAPDETVCSVVFPDALYVRDFLD